MQQKMSIAIVGAGVAGLANAIMLSRLGHQIVIYERFATAQPVGSGLMIQPTGLAALERLGLRDRLATLGHRIKRLHGVTAGNRTIFDLAYGALGTGPDSRSSDAPDWHALAVHRAALHGVLWAGFETSGAAFEPGFDIARIEPKAADRLALVARDGRKTPAYDLIIDGSGTRSPLRALVTQRAARPFTYGAVWATVPDCGIAPGALAQRYVDARIMIGHLPIGRIAADGPALAALFWSLKPAGYDNWRHSYDGWLQELHRLWPELAPTIASLTGPTDFTLATYLHFTADRLSQGRLVLTGDSAHCTSPQLGQGANQAMIDAVVLADAIETAPDLPAALALYARARRRHVAFYQRASALMTPFFQSDSHLLAQMRDLTFDRIKIIPYLHGEMLRTLAGLKTGLFTAAAPDRIVNPLRRDPAG